MITIADYGLGNIRAFLNLYERQNITVTVAKEPGQLLSASKIILPGVGAFDHAMEMLSSSGLRETLDHLVLEKKVPVIGICVGMQMMAISSDEGKLPGLGWINAHVRKFDVSLLKYKPHLPHMGWNNIRIKNNDPILRELDNNSRFYFLHSYYFDPLQDGIVLAESDYGKPFCSVVRKENIYGIQFHPEKSHHNGVRLLSNFALL